MLKILSNIFYKLDEDFLEELEESLIMADCGAKTASAITSQLREISKSKKLTEPNDIREELRGIIEKTLNSASNSKECTNENLKISLIIGVNGVGKTTSIGKLAHFHKMHGKSVMLAAGDTFRAAAVEQLTIWSERADCPIVKNTEATDPSSVVFDAVVSAKSRGINVLLVDTAGRLHNKQGLMEELAKLKRTIEKASGSEKITLETLLVLDASTGQNALSQAKTFGEIVEIDGIILTKLDSTAKGGIVLAIAEEQKIPVKYVGTGEDISNFSEFNAAWFAKELI